MPLDRSPLETRVKDFGDKSIYDLFKKWSRQII